MAGNKINITESSLRGYTGHLFMTEFKNGVTVAPIGERLKNRILATVRSKVVEDKKPKPEPEINSESDEDVTSSPA
uniref:Uncharacterized protein n=1 Tax=Pectobacterium carotovorum TaxID=554 RepID=A0A0K0MPD0_PECCA|nr:hypothetical protein [Pectobacterium carotovorum]AKG47468.1 hypothetical protein pA_00028 [Pectobacterium carotovorum]